MPKNPKFKKGRRVIFTGATGKKESGEVLECFSRTAVIRFDHDGKSYTVRTDMLEPEYDRTK